ncbi:unnamed protein product, partial [marine sediment metagenome]
MELVTWLAGYSVYRLPGLRINWLTGKRGNRYTIYTICNTRY